MILSVAVTATVMYRIERHKQKAAAEQARRSSSSKAKHMPAEEVPDEPAPPPPKPPKVTVLGPAAKEHLAEKSFISSLRAAFLWRSSQPKSPETDRVFLEKLSAITVDDLPPERKSAWLSLLDAWKALGNPAKAEDPQIKEQGRRAAESLNLMFKAHGDLDLVF
ncbi:hypothetical protein G5S37_17510 [Roseimicrobium sp. ORNL1]|nr:hypothetical protein G5S37_17510 [Roseimicrobium sp. ORNL1]